MVLGFGPCLGHVRVERPKVLLYTESFCPPGPLESEPNSRRIPSQSVAASRGNKPVKGSSYSFSTLALAIGGLQCPTFQCRQQHAPSVDCVAHVDCQRLFVIN